MLRVRQHIRVIKDFSRNSTKELENFKRTQKEENLRQAAEKIWGAFTLLIEVLSNKKSHSHSHTIDLYKRIYNRTQDEDLRKLYDNAQILHMVFYGGTDNIGWVMRKIVESNELIEVLMRRYGVGRE